MSSAPARGVLSASPDVLRGAARQLRALGVALEETGVRAGAAAELGEAWTGLAALGHRARAGELCRLIGLTAGPGPEVALALERCADVGEQAGARARSALRRVEEGLGELAALRSVGPPPEPLLEQAWRRRVAEVEAEVARARRVVEEAEEVFDLAQRRAAEVVGGAWSVVEDAPALRRLVDDLRRAVTGLPRHAAHVVRTTDLLVAAARARWAVGAKAREVALARATLRLQELWLQVRAPGEARRRFGRMRLTPGPVGWVGAWLAAWGDERDGGGYAGWRGATTRVLARGALVGGPVALAGLHPALAPAAPVGLGLISLYQTWMLGNEVWDALPTLARYARRSVRDLPVTLRAVGAAAARARDRAAVRLRELGGVTAGRLRGTGERVRTAVEEVTLRGPGTAPLRDRILRVGVPVRLPSVPLGPVLRVPVDLARLPADAGAWGGVVRP